MYIVEELSQFLQFILIGILISIIFDFFRAYRKKRKASAFIVGVQDIIYFVIATIIIILGIIYLLDSNIRLYIFIAIILGALLYFTSLSKYVIKFYMLIFKISKEIIDFFLLPFRNIYKIFVIFYNFLKEKIEKCCKKFFDMVTYVWGFFKKKVVKFTMFLVSKLKTKKINQKSKIKNQKNLKNKRR